MTKAQRDISLGSPFQCEGLLFIFPPDVVFTVIICPGEGG